MPISTKTVSPKDLRTERAAAGLTQAAAAALVYNLIDNRQNWEQGRCPMPPGLYELFLLKTGQIDLTPNPECLFKA